MHNTPHTEETKRKISITKKKSIQDGSFKPSMDGLKEYYKTHPNYNKGKKFPERSGINHPMYGKVYSKETLDKMKETLKQFWSERKGKSLEEIYGIERAKNIITKRSKGKLGKPILKNRTGKYIKCDFCNKEIYRSLSSFKDRKKIFCSNDCQHKSQMKNITKKCEYCSKLFEGKPWYMEKRRFCSNQCRNIALSGENHHNWNNGSHLKPYDKRFNNLFKRRIRKRDNYVCMICGIHSEKLKGALDIHHINYDKLNSIPENCISLCKSCHGKTLKNKHLWQKFFQSLLHEKYGYDYSEEELPIIKIEEKGGIR